MDADRVEELREMLFAVKSIDSSSRRWNAVVEELARANSPETLEVLAGALNSNRSKALSDVVVRVLGEVAASGTVHPIYEVWWATRHPRLTELLVQEGWVADFASHVRAARELESGDLENLVKGGHDVVIPLVKAATDTHPQMRERALRCLHRLANADAIDALCTLWAENRSPMLRELVERRGYVARAPAAAKVLSALAANRLEHVVQAGPEIALPLVQACSDSDPDISSRAMRCLSKLENRLAVDALLEIWAHDRSQELDEAVIQAGYVARSPLMNRVLSALKCNRTDLIVDLELELVHPVVVAIDDRDPVISERAEKLLEDVLYAQEFRNALCRVVIEHGLPRAREIALKHACRPTDVQYRALFFFLTEQWDEYESLDFDMSLLSNFFEHGGKGLRARIADTARRSGRLELVELVAGVRHKRHMGEMTSREWEVTLSILDDRRDWATMWRLAQSAPAVWSARALGRLAEVGWSPQGSEEIHGFENLKRYSRALKDEAPILGMVDSPTAQFKAHGRRVSRLIVNSYFDRTLASASWDGTVRFWSMPDGKLTGGLTAHRHPVTALAASADGDILVTGCGAEERVIVWSMPEATPAKILPGHARGVSCLAMSSDGRLLAAGGYDGVCRLWRLRDGALLTEIPASGESLRCACFSPHGELLATSGEDTVIRLWSVPAGEEVNHFRGHSMTVRALAFAPGGAFLASGGSDNDVILWEISAREAAARMKGHTNVVTSLAISGDGRILASAAWDRTVRMWVLPDATAWGKLEQHTGPVTCLATDPESRMLVSGGHDCTVVMWNFQSGVFRRPTTRLDMERIEHLSGQPADSNEKSWLEFLLAQMKWRWRFDIELDAAPSKIEVGEFDIEVEG